MSVVRHNHSLQLSPVVHLFSTALSTKFIEIQNRRHHRLEVHNCRVKKLIAKLVARQFIFSSFEIHCNKNLILIMYHISDRLKIIFSYRKMSCSLSFTWEIFRGFSLTATVVFEKNIYVKLIVKINLIS